MAEVKWTARRISDGVLVDVTGDTESPPLAAPTQNELEAGGSVGWSASAEDPGAVGTGAVWKQLPSGDFWTRNAGNTGWDAGSRSVATATGANDADVGSFAQTVNGSADATSIAQASGSGGADAGLSVEASGAGTAKADSYAENTGSGTATVYNQAVANTGTAVAEVSAQRGAAKAGVSVIVDGTSARMGFFGATPVAKAAANADTSGATLAALETEVNELKALLRAYGLLAT